MRTRHFPCSQNRANIRISLRASAQSPAGDRPDICCAVAPQAAQALEPAALIPLPLLAPAGRVVLVGDPAQLPATVLSKAAAAANLAQSLFERLQRVRVLG